MKWVGLAIFVVIALVILYYTVSFTVGLVWCFTVELYRVMRYDRHGVCYKCKQPFVSEVELPADQTYGPDRISQATCSCGVRSVVRGNRRFADWSDF